MRPVRAMPQAPPVMTTTNVEVDGVKSSAALDPVTAFESVTPATRKERP